mmetsp:Transcript_131708/g.328436  ORF Transcript_131708/g.328436 Transcript_131708/m.328436 type:complete len:325 (+) Transcript_131708:93-1067(+)
MVGALGIRRRSAITTSQSRRFGWAGACAIAVVLAAVAFTSVSVRADAHGSNAAFVTPSGQPVQSVGMPHSARPAGVRAPTAELAATRMGVASGSGMAILGALLMCLAAGRAVGKVQPSIRRGVGCRVVATNSRCGPMSIPRALPLQVVPSMNPPAAHIGALEVQPCAAVLPIGLVLGEVLASDTQCRPRAVAEVQNATATATACASQDAAFGCTASPRCRAARRVGAARHARSRGSRRGVAARATRRRVGAMLQRPRTQVPEVGSISYDPSCVREKIQMGLRTACRQRLQRGREVCTMASSENMSALNDSYTAMSNFFEDMTSN